MTSPRSPLKRTVRRQHDPHPAAATSRVERLIDDYMRRYPGAHGKYYEAVHQGLAPLARELEWNLRALLEEFDRVTSNNPSPYEVRKAVADSARAALTPNAALRGRRPKEHE